MIIKNYILTSDRLVDKTMEMIEYFYKKYSINLDVIVLGYKYPSYKSDFIKFESLGIDKGPNSVCQQLFNHLSKKNDEYFIFEVDDKPIIKKIDNDIINRLMILLEQDKKIGRIGLTLDNYYRSNKIFKQENNITFYINDSNERHKMSATNSIWRKDYFLKYLKNYNNLWEWEVDSYNETINDNYKIIGTIPAVTDFIHLFQRGLLKNDWHTSPHTNNKLDNYDFQKIKNIYNI